MQLPTLESPLINPLILQGRLRIRETGPWDPVFPGDKFSLKILVYGILDVRPGMAVDTYLSLEGRSVFD